MNRMFTLLVMGTAALTLTGFGNASVHERDFVDTAEVLWVKPVYEIVEISQPVKECWKERAVHRGRNANSHTGVIAGGIIGGVLGNRIGHGRGRPALTVAGTLLGASIGHDLSRRTNPASVSLQRHCEIVDHIEEREQIVGYRVKYEYMGKSFVTRTREHPGEYLRLRVNVDPINRFE